MANGKFGEILSNIVLAASQSIRRNAANDGFEAFTPASGDPETDPVFSASEAANFVTGDKSKLDGIAAGAEVNVNADWNAGSGDAQILNKPTIPTALADLTADATHRVVTDAEKSTWNGKQDALGFTAVPNTRTVNGHALSADVTVTQTDVGLGNVDNTSDANKPVSSAQQTALDGKLSTSGVAADVNIAGTNIAAALAGKLGTSAQAADVNPAGTSIAAALAGKQAAGSYLTSANIEDSIVDAHTTIAPSGNAVFDALAGKLGTSAQAADVNPAGTSIAAALSGKLATGGTAADVNPAGTSIAAALAGKAATSQKLDDFGTPDNNTDLNANTTNHGLLLVATAPAANVLNVVGIANGETSYANKALFDGTNPAALGTAAPGTSLIAAHRDHVHANPALDTLAVPTDITTLDATSSAHGLVVKAVVPAAGVRNVVAIDNGETIYKNTALVDGTNPAALGVAAPGTQLIAARRDHVHAMPTAANVSAIATSVLAAKGDLLTASAASTAAVITAVATGKVLQSAGVAQTPVWYSPPYCMSGGALSFAMVSSTQYYFGIAAAPTTTKGQHRIYIPITGTMIASQVSWFRSSGSATTSWTMNYYYNGGNAVSMGALATAANMVWLKTADNLAVTAGQYIEFGTSTPAWGANQTGILSYWLLILPTA